VIIAKANANNIMPARKKAAAIFIENSNVGLLAAKY
jgi:hypothetical protein